MAVVVVEEHQAVGDWSVDVDYSPALHAELVDDIKRPRKLHAQFYDPLGALIYTGVLLRVGGDELGLTIGGRGLLWWMGEPDTLGPIIVDREYVSGLDKLGNGTFALGGLYWRRVAQLSNWLVAVGGATNSGGLAVNDTLESDEKFPTLPGKSYRLRATGVSGSGRIRLRTLYEGNFNPPNLVVNPGMESGPGVGWGAATYLAIISDSGNARSGSYVMRLSPIPNAQLVLNPTFASGTNWSRPDSTDITDPLTGDISIINAPAAAFGGASWVMICEPNPWPQLLINPDFELGSGYPWAVASTGDVGFINDATKAHGGSWALKVGPIAQKQLILNPTFETADHWYQNTELADPSTVFYYDPHTTGASGGMDGSQGYTTAGVTGGAEQKYARAQFSGAAGVDPATVIPGEEYELEAHVRAASSTDGRVWVNGHIPHPTVANRERVYPSQTLDCSRMATDIWNRLAVSIPIPANRFALNVVLNVNGQHGGYVAWDNVTLTRIRGNRSRMNSVAYPVVPNMSYKLVCFIKSGDGHTDGTTRVGVTLTGTGLISEVHDVDQGLTDYVWTRVQVDFTPGTGYVNATPYVMGIDVNGDSMYLDDLKLFKTSNNTAEATGTSFAVLPDQRYLLSAPVRSGPDVTRGSVKVGVKLNGPGMAEQIVAFDQSSTNNAWQNGSVEVRPGPGFTTATPFVRSIDIEGDLFYIGKFEFVKLENNSDSSQGTGFGVTPERTYRFQAAVRSDAGLQRGTAKLAVQCVRSGHADLTFESPPMTATNNAWKTISFDFTPPSGYDTVVPRIVGTDIEGGKWYVDDVDLRDTDTSTMALDATSTNPSGATITNPTTAPAGAETVRCQIVVEEGSTSWTVGAVSFARTGVTPATGNAIVAGLLLDPVTGAATSLVAGTITCPEVIPYDWHLLNLTNRAALDHYCAVVSDPPREYRVNPNRTLDVGTAAAVFTDHSPSSATPIVLLPTDVDVEPLPDVVLDSEQRPTQVKVLGADRATVSGQPLLITATASVAGTPQLDRAGNPVERTRLHSDGTVDHFGYAQALADDLAAREAAPALTMNVKLTGVNTRPAFTVGDWIYIYHPEGGLEDPTYATTIEGETVFPRRVRVLSRPRTLGPGHSIVMRREDGTTFALTGVNWSEEDATALTVGDRRPDWQSDPQGPAAGVQYVRDRASRPR